MTDGDRIAQRRWMMLVGTRLIGVAGAVFGMVLLARAHDWVPKLIGVGIVLSALAVIAIVPASLAHRWRSPGP
jgi:hypothetical protein